MKLNEKSTFERYYTIRRTIENELEKIRFSDIKLWNKSLPRINTLQNRLMIIKHYMLEQSQKSNHLLSTIAYLGDSWPAAADMMDKEDEEHFRLLYEFAIKYNKVYRHEMKKLGWHNG